ncbi:MAG: redox-regulated ATPase YchF [Tissierellia bacterium]|nr:redox-regulated ATPase YchF [Tissierellia bacterium]
MKLGIVGLPNVGKSTLFNAITKAGAESANYPFCTIDPNMGVVDVPDPRLASLSKLYNSEKILPAQVTFFDIAGLVKGASHGEGLGNKFLSHIREVDAILHVVRCFEDPNVTHVEATIDPKRDIEIINMELILADLEVLERRKSRVERQLKGDKAYAVEYNLILKLIAHLENERRAKSCPLEKEEVAIYEQMQLLTSKPVIYVANVSMEDQNPASLKDVEAIAKAEGELVLPISAQIEEEIADLDDEDKELFLKEMGLESSGLDRLIRASYALLNLISFITAGPTETKAWTIMKGTKAVDAAGKIHSDIQRGFIRAETISYEELNRIGSMVKAKELGAVRLEGKEYVVKDGDVILFRFNV